MSELRFVLEEIDDGTGLIREVYQMRCACSNIEPEVDEDILCDAFYTWWEPPHNHIHVQCYDCEQTYCPQQLCIPPPTAEVIGNER